MGTEGSEGRWVRQACIGWSVILNYQVCYDKTSGGCYIPTVPTHCPRLTANVTARLSPPIGRMDDTMCGGHGGVCVWGQRDGQTRVRAGSSPFSPAHLSHNTAPPLRDGDSRGPEHGQMAGRCVAALAGRRRSTAHEDDAAAVLRTVPLCN